MDDDSWRPRKEEIWAPADRKQSMKDGAKELATAFVHLIRGFKYIMLHPFKIYMWMILVIVILAIGITSMTVKSSGSELNFRIIDSTGNAVYEKEAVENMITGCATCDLDEWKNSIVDVVCPKIENNTSECVQEEEKGQEESKANDTEEEPSETADEKFYRCSNGVLVVGPEDCKKFFPEINEKFSKEKNGLTISFDGISYRLEDNETYKGYIKYINFTLINRGEEPINAEVQVKTYEEWDSDAKLDYPDDVFKISKELKEGDWIVTSGYTNIYFDSLDRTVRLIVYDPEEEEEIMFITRDLE